MEEEWRPVAGVEGYEVSNLGNIRSYRKAVFPKGKRGSQPGLRSEPKPIKQTSTAEGYVVWGARPQYKAHHTVLEAFVGPKPEGMQARHLNGVRHDNRVENLAWGTPKEDRGDRIAHGTSNEGEKHPSAKLMWDEVREIRASDLLPRELAEQYLISTTAIRSILRNETWVDADYIGRCQRGHLLTPENSDIVVTANKRRRVYCLLCPPGSRSGQRRRDFHH